MHNLCIGITVRNGNELAEQQSTQTVASPSKAEEHLIALVGVQCAI